MVKIPRRNNFYSQYQKLGSIKIQLLENELAELKARIRIQQCKIEQLEKSQLHQQCYLLTPIDISSSQHLIETHLGKINPEGVLKNQSVRRELKLSRFASNSKKRKLDQGRKNYSPLSSENGMDFQSEGNSDYLMSMASE